MKFFGVNHTLTNENFRRLKWLSDNDPNLAGKTVNEMVNAVIAEFFEKSGLDRLMPTRAPGGHLPTRNQHE